MSDRQTMKKTFYDYVVVFSNGASHHCKTLESAKQFARDVRGTVSYGDPVEIVKHTRHVVSIFDTVWKGE